MNLTTMSDTHLKVEALDHLVLTVSSIPASIEFYTTNLGMEHVIFTSPKDPSVVRHSLVFGKQKINLHQFGAEFEPKAGFVQPGSADLCFLTESPVQEALQILSKKGEEILEGGVVVERTGARGRLRSLYIRDPDGNLVE